MLRVRNGHRLGTLGRMDDLTREQVDAFEEPAVLEFGATWCGYCQAAQADIASVMKRHPTVRHIKIEDGKGRPLGRSFRVKLWPTLIYLEKGAETGRVVRPGSARDIEAIFTGTGAA
jgi:thioredoxin 1